LSYLDRIREVNRYDPAGFMPFRVAGKRVGAVRPRVAARLAEFAEVFVVDGPTLRLTPRLDAPDTPSGERSAALVPVLTALRRQGMVPGWRDEPYPVLARWGEPPLLTIERAAVPLLGVSGFGVHLNGYVRDGARLAMWIARRATDKPTWPGKLDQLVAGGQPAGIGLRANLIKESAEEAGMRPELAARARPVGAFSYTFEDQRGLRPDTVFCFDLELPGGFRPVNRDGEVADFQLRPIDEAATLARDTREFKPNCALVVIDFLLRHGYLDADAPDYLDIVAGLGATHGPSPFGP